MAPTERGNRATQQLLRSRQIQAKLHVAPPGDVLEDEADRMAVAVTTASAPCHCGGRCASCRGEDDDLLHRAPKAKAEAVAPELPDQFLSALGSGEPLGAGPRDEMERRFGTDFGGVRIHQGPEATHAAGAIGARAFTAGEDVVFDRHEYQPETAEGRSLLAHELTHVTQQRGRDPAVQRQRGTGQGSDTPAQTGPQAEPELATVDAFEAAVFAKALRRLEENLITLEEWRSNLAKAFDDLDLQAQVYATQALELAGLAQVSHRESWYEALVTTRSPASRRLDEAVIRGEIHGGCQQCHESNTVWAWNAAHSDQLGGPNLQEMLGGMADRALERRRRFTPLQPAGPASGAVSQVGAIAYSGPAPDPRASAPAGVPVPPVTHQYPRPRTDLCGELPPSGNTPVPRPPPLWGPASRAILESIARIHPVLAPLGPEGYQILPEHIFTDLYQVGPAELRAIVNSKLDERRDGFYQLAALISAGAVDYKELCPIVEELLFAATPDVRLAVLTDIHTQRAAEAILDILMKIAMVALLFLSVMFPPAAIVVGLALGAAMVGTGAQNMYRGALYTRGPGAGIFSPQQVASGPGLYTGGALGIAQGLLMIGMSGIGLIEPGAPETAMSVPESELLVPETPASGWNATEIPHGEVMFTNPAMPEVAAFADAEGLSCWIGDEEVAFYPWSSAQPTAPNASLMLPQGGPAGSGLVSLPESPPLSVFPEGQAPLLLPEAPVSLPEGPISLPEPPVSQPAGPGPAGPLATRSPQVLVGPADTAGLRVQYRLAPGDGVVAIGRSSHSELQGLDFEGASPGIREETPILTTTQRVVSPRSNAQFVEHAEEGVINNFLEAVEARGLTPDELDGTTFGMHITQAPCSACGQGLTGTNVDPGVIMNLSLRYPGMTVRVTWDLPSGRTGFMIIQGGAVLFRGGL